MSAKRIENLSDDKLLKLMRKGNRLAFSQLYDRYWSPLFYTAKDLTDHDMAMDIVQEVMVSLWMKRGEIEIKNLAAYLKTAVKFKVFQQFRNRKVAQHHLQKINNIQFAHTTEDQLNLNELNQKLEHVLQQLPDKCRQVFELSRFEQLSHKEIADKMGISQNTVSNHIARALRQLRASIGELVTVATIFYLG